MANSHFWHGVSPIVPPTGTDYTQDANCMGAWLLTEASGDLVDASGEGHTLADAGTPVYQQTDPYGGTNAITLDGSSERFEKEANGTTLDIVGNKLSVCAWVKPATVSVGERNILRKNNVHYNLIQKDDEFRFEVNVSSSATSALSTDVNAQVGSWYFVVGTYDGDLGSNNIKLYVNNVLKAQANKTGNLSARNTGETFTIGVFKNNTTYQDYFNGTIGEGAVFNKALTEAEIADIYANGLQS